MESPTISKNSVKISEVSVPLHKAIGKSIFSETISEKSSESEVSTKFQPTNKNQRSLVKLSSPSSNTFDEEEAKCKKINDNLMKRVNNCNNQKISFKQLENNFCKKKLDNNNEMCYKQERNTQGYQNIDRSESNIRLDNHPETRKHQNANNSAGFSNSSQETEEKNRCSQRPRMNYDMLKKLNKKRYK